MANLVSASFTSACASLELARRFFLNSSLVVSKIYARSLGLPFQDCPTRKSCLYKRNGLDAIVVARYIHPSETGVLSE